MICLFDLGASFWANWFGSKLDASAAYELTMNDVVTHYERYSRFALCCDSRSKRHDIYPEYKANRPPKPPEATEALKLVETQCAELGITVLKCDGYEADDIMATLASQADEPCWLVTADKDLYACITDRVKLLAKGEETGATECVKRFGVPPIQVRDWLAIVGDAADNVPGCPGIGPVRAIDLLRTFGSIAAIKSASVTELRSVRGIGPSAVKAVLEWDPELAVKLVTLFTDAPVSLRDVPARTTRGPAERAPKPQQQTQQQPQKTTEQIRSITMQFETGFKKDPLFLVVHGQEGVGKSSFAACAPNPVFADLERKAAVLGVPRKSPASWAEMEEIIAFLAKGEHDRRSLIIDTADALEFMLHAHLCRAEGKSTLGDIGGGWGKGEKLAAENWTRFIDDLDRLRFERGMHVIVIAHSDIRTFQNPEGADFDRWQMKLDKRASAVFRERSTACLFARYDVATKTDKTKTIGLSTGARVLETEHNAAWDAKNTLDLPSQIPLESPPKGWLNFAAHVRDFYARKLQQSEPTKAA